ncbi:hypothetical protein LTR36_001947 [Oleoguttula mirabilis]|uniref:Uncharacterized protein n=1 Tax=Oleoguttula mirabilis TaxID=1507867 RepID=A0AAV9JLN9_9PEZI|nr:hypothetical protein LTR36_001947 [Oleoguttula mirabilis]
MNILRFVKAKLKHARVSSSGGDGADQTTQASEQQTAQASAQQTTEASAQQTTQAIAQQTTPISAQQTALYNARQTIRDGILQRLASGSVLLGRATLSTDANTIYAFGVALYGQDRWSLATEAFVEFEPFELAPRHPGGRRAARFVPVASVAKQLQVERSEDESPAKNIERRERAGKMVDEAVKLLRQLGEEEKAKGLENLQAMAVGRNYTPGIIGSGSG